VAPEGDGVHERLSRLLSEAGVCLLGSLPPAIAVAADKWECSRRFAAAGLRAPETVCVSPAQAAAAAAALGYPIVVKPRRGAGCGGVALVPDRSLLATALGQPALRRSPSILVQRYVDGVAASVSLLVAGGRALVLSLNGQQVRAGVPFVYDGGEVPLAHPRRDEACQLARRAVALVPGLQGYVGVDLVLGEESCSVIEINPRPTSSYVGLRRVVDLNLGAAIWDACREGVLPDAVNVAGAAAFGGGPADDA
jgi:hypothetical protein